jgi:hypothetical protein
MYLLLKDGELSVRYDEAVGLLAQINADEFQRMYLPKIEYRIRKKVLTTFMEDQEYLDPYRKHIRKGIREILLAHEDFDEARCSLADRIETQGLSRREATCWLEEFAIFLCLLELYPR